MIKSVKNVLETVFSQHNSLQLQLLNNWSAIVGNFQTKVQLLKIFEDTLVIGVLDSCWLQELYLLSPLLLKKINEQLDQPRIKHLRFRCVVTPEKKKAKEVPKRCCTLKSITLSKEEKDALSALGDTELAHFLEGYLLRVYREQ